MGNHFVFFAMALMLTMSYGQVGIGTTTPSPAAMLEVSSTSDEGTTYKGLMPPRVPTIIERNAINPSEMDAGLLVFVESLRCLQIWNGASWDDVTCTSSPIPILASWDFDGNDGDEVNVSADVALNIDSGLVSRGIGINPAINANRFNANNFNEPDFAAAFANHDYFEFTIIPSTGYPITITEVFFYYERSATGPRLGVLRSDIDNFTTNLATFTDLAMSDSKTIDLSSPEFTNLTSTIIFRLYLYGNVGSLPVASGGFEGPGNDLEIRGTID
ncbi:hypothetical protein [Aequorivita marina]|uniref:hypothetical protein n=1 Tax=Aequorivita marina TaxID=3073654 RepID=UPI00287543F8|nr:hypothetical protein [Aequorivita sp. S2608]MDS1297710.1 hypothetical protein [Aequorivita sp. S2608]